MNKLFKYITIITFVILVIFISYYLIATSETFRPKFPKEFDTLVIDNYESYWKVKRNKKVDEFIRASKVVSEHIGEGLDVYVLRFFSNDKEVFVIAYDETGYPDKATKIMTDIMNENVAFKNTK